MQNLAEKERFTLEKIFSNDYDNMSDDDWSDIYLSPNNQETMGYIDLIRSRL